MTPLVPLPPRPPPLLLFCRQLSLSLYGFQKVFESTKLEIMKLFPLEIHNDRSFLLWKSPLVVFLFFFQRLSGVVSIDPVINIHCKGPELVV